MELMLDTANIEDIRKGVEIYPISGVTTNPSIMQQASATDFFGHLATIRDIIGPDRSLHVQVVREDFEGIIKEAEKIRKRLGDNTFVKIPVTEEGLKAIKFLTEQGYQITATAVYTTLQGITAMLAGAKYIAVYYNRMLNIDIEASRVIKELSSMLWAQGGTCQLLAASFKNISEITTAYACGASVCTVPFTLLEEGLRMPSIQHAINNFYDNWREVYGDKTILDL